jgi:S1-C subfamily serine protease
VREGKVYIGGAGTGTNLRPMLEAASTKWGIKGDFSDNAGFDGSSDHVSFVAKQVPAVFFFSGLHADYHKPSDTWDKINAPGAATLLAAVGEIAAHLADDPGRPEFVRAEPATPGPAAAGDSAGTGYGPWFGSVPDFGETAKGVKFADVTAGSPAAKAGLRTGDTLIEFEGKPVGNLYDFTYALRTHKPGDEVAVKVLRGGETVETKVTLGERPR